MKDCIFRIWGSSAPSKLVFSLSNVLSMLYAYAYFPILSSDVNFVQGLFDCANGFNHRQHMSDSTKHFKKQN